MTEQEYKTEIAKLRAELRELREKQKEAKRIRTNLPLSIAEKYGAKPLPNGYSTNKLPFLNRRGIDLLSQVVRGSLFPHIDKRVKSGCAYEYVKKLDEMTLTEYEIYLECMDKMLSVLKGYEAWNRRTNNGKV